MYHRLLKHSERSYSELFPIFGNLQTTKGKKAANFVFLGSNIVKRLRPRIYYQAITEKAIGLSSFAVAEEWLLLSIEWFVLFLWLADLQPCVQFQLEHKLLWLMLPDICDILYYHTRCMCTYFDDLSALADCWSSVFLRILIQMCAISSIQLLRLMGKLDARKPVLTHQFGGCRNSTKWLLAEQCSWKSWKVMPKEYRNKLKLKGSQNMSQNILSSVSGHGYVNKCGVQKTKSFTYIK